MTPQRLAILRILQEADGHMTPVEICQKAQSLLPGITEATVYRTLTFLSQQGLLMAAHIGSGQLVYEYAGHAHHHLICRTCGQTQEIDHGTMLSLYDRLMVETGFKIDSMHVTFFGLCPECQRNS
jgi:Fe2+ or Zn2+ uptake regulation protein